MAGTMQYEYDTNQVEQMATAVSFRSRRLTPGEFAFVTRILDWRTIRRGPRTEIMERGIAAGTLTEDHRLIVSRLSEAERQKLLMAVMSLPDQQRAIREALTAADCAPKAETTPESGGRVRPLGRAIETLLTPPEEG